MLRCTLSIVFYLTYLSMAYISELYSDSDVESGHSSEEITEDHQRRRRQPSFGHDKVYPEGYDRNQKKYSKCDVDNTNNKESS